jgi:hypothetical protein
MAFRISLYLAALLGPGKFQKKIKTFIFVKKSIVRLRELEKLSERKN